MITNQLRTCTQEGFGGRKLEKEERSLPRARLSWFRDRNGAAFVDHRNWRRGDRSGGQSWSGGGHRCDWGGRHAGVTEAHLALLRRATAEDLH